MKTVLTSFIENTNIDHAALHERVTATSVTYSGYSKSEAEKQIPTLASRIYRAGPVLSLVWQRSKQTYYVLLPQGESLQLDDPAVSIKPLEMDALPKWVITSLLVRATPRLLGRQEEYPERLEADGLYYVVDRKPLKGTGNIIIDPIDASVNGPSIRVPNIRGSSNFNNEKTREGDQDLDKLKPLLSLLIR
ncbi:MAG: hypothetical protein ACQEV6_18135 [Pseudomonadota bacterium]